MINLSKTQNVSPRTLVQIMTEAEEQNGAIKVANFDSFADWMAYYNQHYKPVLEAFRGEDVLSLSNEDCRMLNFLCDDLLNMFKK